MDGHAGHSETSMMLFLCSERVRLDAVTVGELRPVPCYFPTFATGSAGACAPGFARAAFAP
jgi:creatinine amidohydrolase/Fe(II)-dependent formamide hydrolase-like protein